MRGVNAYWPVSMSIPLTTTRSSSPAGLGAFTRNVLFRKVFVTPAYATALPAVRYRMAPVYRPPSRGSPISLIRIGDYSIFRASSSRSRSFSVLYRWKPTRTAPARVEARMPAVRSSSAASAIGIDTMAEFCWGRPSSVRARLASPTACASTAAPSRDASHGSVSPGAQRTEPGGRGIEPPRAVGQPQRQPVDRLPRVLARIPVRDMWRCDPAHPVAQRHPRGAARRQQPLVDRCGRNVGPAHVDSDFPAERLRDVDHGQRFGARHGAPHGVDVEDGAVGGLHQAGRDDIEVGRSRHQLIGPPSR